MSKFLEQLLAEGVEKGKRIAELKQKLKRKQIETINDTVLNYLAMQGIENFTTNHLKTQEGRNVELTIRYVDGETPAEKLVKQAARIAELEEYKLGELARCAEQSEKESEYEGKLLDRIAELEKEVEVDNLTIVNNYNLMDASAKQIEELRSRLQRTNGELANTIHEVNYYKNREVSEDEDRDTWGFEVVFDNDMYLLEEQ